MYGIWRMTMNKEQFEEMMREEINNMDKKLFIAIIDCLNDNSEGLKKARVIKTLKGVIATVELPAETQIEFGKMCIRDSTKLF